LGEFPPEIGFISILFRVKVNFASTISYTASARKIERIIEMVKSAKIVILCSAGWSDGKIEAGAEVDMTLGLRLQEATIGTAASSL
jgi:hypothetical protein